MRKRIKNIAMSLKRNPSLILSIIAVIFFTASFFVSNNLLMVSKERSKVERILRNRLNILEKYSMKALEMPADEWMEFNNFPDDMVIYKYHSDILQSWANLFPISVDDLYPNPAYGQIGRAHV